VSPTAELSGVQPLARRWSSGSCATLPKRAAIEKVAQHDPRRTCRRLCPSAGGGLSRSSSCLGIIRRGPPRAILARGSVSRTLLMTSWHRARCRSGLRNLLQARIFMHCPISRFERPEARSRSSRRIAGDFPCAVLAANFWGGSCGERYERALRKIHRRKASSLPHLVVD
jgi:hypothetical protein